MIIHFLKALVTAKSNMKKYLQNFLKINLNSRKTENVQIHFKITDAKFFRKKYAICFLLFKAFQRAIKSRNPMS